MEGHDQQRFLLDKLRAALMKVSDTVDRLESHAMQLGGVLLSAEELAAREEDLARRILELGFPKEKADLERSLARFPLDLPGALSALSQELRSLLPILEGASQTTQVRVNRLLPLPERLQQAMRQREAVLERIQAAVGARVEEADRKKELAALDEGSDSQFEVGPPSGEIVVSQTQPAVAVEILLDEPNRIMPPLPSSDMPGVFVSTPTPPELGMPVHLLGHLPDGRVIEADGFVSWRREGTHPEESGFGIELAAIREEDRNTLLDLLSR